MFDMFLRFNIFACFFCSKNVKKVLIHFSLHCVWIKLPWSNTYCIDIVNKTQTWMLMYNTRTNCCPQIYTSCIVMNNSLNILLLFMNKKHFSPFWILLMQHLLTIFFWLLKSNIFLWIMTHWTERFMFKDIDNGSASVKHRW